MPEVSPAKRGRIIRELHASADQQWSGLIGGRRVELEIRGVEVRWRVCVKRHWRDGVAGTVWAALEAIDSDPLAPLFTEKRS